MKVVYLVPARPSDPARKRGGGGDKSTVKPELDRYRYVPSGHFCWRNNKK